MTVENRLAYITLVDWLSESVWSPYADSPYSKSMSSLFSTADLEGEMYNRIDEIERVWDIVIRKLICMAEGRRKNFLGDIKDSREMWLYSARIQLYYASLLPVNDINLINLRDKFIKQFKTPEWWAKIGKEMPAGLDLDPLPEVQLPEVYRKEAEEKWKRKYTITPTG